ncbi:DUF3800 domain-containing protein [Schleiferilactobacillus harbinensis]|jgi:hypothetical protein
MATNDTLPEKLKQELLRTKESTKNLAVDIGISYASLQSYLTGRTQPGAKNRGILEAYFEKVAEELAAQPAPSEEKAAAPAAKAPTVEEPAPVLTDYSIYMDESFDPEQQGRGNNLIVVSGILVPQLEEASSLKKFQDALYPFGWDKGDEVKAHFKTNENIVKILQMSHDKYIDYAGLKTEKVPVLLTRNNANERFSQTFPYIRLLSELIGHTLAGKHLPQLNLTITMDHSPIIDENQLRMVRESLQKHLLLKYQQRSSIYITSADSKDRLGLQLADFLANYLNRVATKSIDPVIDLIPFNHDNSEMAQQFVYFYGLQDQRINYSALPSTATDEQPTAVAATTTTAAPAAAVSTSSPSTQAASAAPQSAPTPQVQIQAPAAQMPASTADTNSNHGNGNNTAGSTAPQPTPSRKQPVIHKLDAHLSRPVPTSTQYFTNNQHGTTANNRETTSAAPATEAKAEAKSTDDSDHAPRVRVAEMEKVNDFVHDLLPLNLAVLANTTSAQQDEYRDTVKGITTIIFSVLPSKMKGQLITGKPRKTLKNITDLLEAVHNAEKSIPTLKIKDKHGQLTAARTMLEKTLQWADKNNITPAAID